MFSKSALFQKLNGVRLGCAFFQKKKCANGIRNCTRVRTNKLPLRKVTFYKFRTINVFNLGLALCRHSTDSFETRAWNFTLLILASYSFRTLCSLFCSLFLALLSFFALFLLLSFWTLLCSLVSAFVSLALSGLFGSVLSLCCFVSVFVWPPCRKIFVCSCAFGWAQ